MRPTVFPYLLLFIVPALMCFVPVRGDKTARLTAWGMVFVGYTLFIGLRHEVGTDWLAYLNTYLDFSQEQARRPDVEDLLTYRDSGFGALNWLFAWLGLGIHAVNLACAAIFMGGLISFSRRQPNPWLAFCVAVPYLVVVVAIGYTRQAVAIGLLFFALNALIDRRVIRFVLLVLLAATFHKTVLPFVMLALLSKQTGLWKTLLLLGLASLSVFLVIGFLGPLWAVYIEASMVSEGGKIRALMTAAAGLVFFFFWKRWDPNDRWLWGWFALASFVSLGLVDLASTAVDRLALYLAPLQMVVWSRAPSMMRFKPAGDFVGICVLATYATVLVVWLMYSPYGPDWMPYKTSFHSW